MMRNGTSVAIPTKLKKGSGFKPTYNYVQDNWFVPDGCIDISFQL